MPLGGGRDKDRLVGRTLQGQEGLSLGLLHCHHLDGLPLPIQAVELGGDLPGLDRVLRQQQPRAEGGIADTAAGIDARPHEIAEMPGLRRSGEACRVEQRRQTDPAAALHDGKALAHEGTVEAKQRHHIRYRRQRHQIEAAH